MENDRQHIALLSPPGCAGAELGVASGGLTRRFMDLGHFGHFYAVDKWDDSGHNAHEYRHVVQTIGGLSGLSIVQMDAKSWLALQKDDSLGFVYIDCYAHTGQDNGSILEAAWPKLAEGGLFSGDDYDQKKWKLNYNAVNNFAESVGKRVNVYDNHLRPDAHRSQYDLSPSWWFIK